MRADSMVGMSPEPDDRLRQLAEELALTLSTHGLQRSTARVLAALVVTPEETMTAAQLMEELGSSSGAVSNAIKQLVPTGLVERAPVPEPRHHYRLKPGGWAALMTLQNQSLTAIGDFAHGGLKAVDPASPAAVRLSEMASFYDFVAREIPALVHKWSAEQDRATGTATP